MLNAIGAIAEHTRTHEQRQSLIHEAKLLKAAGERELKEPSDLEDVEHAFQAAMRAFRAAGERQE